MQRKIVKRGIKIKTRTRRNQKNLAKQMIRKKEKKERKKSLSWRKGSLAMEMMHGRRRLSRDQCVVSIVGANVHGALAVDFCIQE